MNKGYVVLALLLIGGGVAAYMNSSQGTAKPPVTVDVTVPELSLTARRGAGVFATHCAECHGSNAGGTDQGPPLVHPYYEPNHHADGAFHLAVKNGVRPHHWPYGPMPAQPQVTTSETNAIISFVRELQRANGIGG